MSYLLGTRRLVAYKASSCFRISPASFRGSASLFAQKNLDFGGLKNVRKSFEYNTTWKLITRRHWGLGRNWKGSGCARLLQLARWQPRYQWSLCRTWGLFCSNSARSPLCLYSAVIFLCAAWPTLAPVKTPKRPISPSHPSSKIRGKLNTGRITWTAVDLMMVWRTTFAGGSNTESVKLET